MFWLYVKQFSNISCICLAVAFIKFDIQPKAGFKLYDQSGTEIDDEVFEDVVNDPNCGVLKLTAAQDDGEC